MSFIQWILNNKTWIFSGIGLLILSWLFQFLFKSFKHKNQGSIILKQRAKSGTKVLQAGRDINLTHSPKIHKPKLRVLVHRGYFSGNPVEYFFIKIVNITSKVNIVVTHVWYKNGQRIDILNRPLPVRIKSNGIWETFIPSVNITNENDVFQHFHVLISTGEVFDSEHNKDVPPVGYIA